MGKIDDMRKQREAQYAERLARAKAAPKTVAPAPPAPPRAKPPVTADPRKQAGPGEGRCAECGKLRALKNGLITAHQKGLGTPCPGSRKEPA